MDLPADTAFPPHGRTAPGAFVRRTVAGDGPASRADDRNLWRGAGLPHVPQGRRLVRETAGTGARIQTAHRQNPQPDGIRRGARALPAVARAVLRRARRTAAEVPAQETRRLLHADG